MSWNPDVAFVNDYHNQLEHKFQQEGSRLRGTVSVVTQRAESDFFDRIDDISDSTAHAMTVRHGDTPLDDVVHTRRRNQMVGYNHNLMFDNQDRLRMLIDPKSDYAKAQAMMLGRKLDKIIIAAATGTAYSGQAGATSVSHPSGSQIAVDYVETGAAVNSNLTIAKLRRACFLFDEDEVHGETRYLVAAASQKQSLLRTTEVTSADFNTVKALVNGEINTFLGFTFVWTQLLTKTSNTRTCLAYVPSGIRVGMGEELKVRVDERKDKNYSWQVYSEMTAGATRMWEERVLDIACDESV
jgi:hypothetical protein